MSRLHRLIAARTLSVLAIAATVTIPWSGWSALTVSVILASVGIVLVPPAPSHSHESNLRRLYRTVQRRVVRHPWRPRHP